MPTPCTKILLVDSEPLTRLGLVHFLRNHPPLRLCAATENGRSARRLCIQHRPDVVLVGLTLEEGDSLALITEWRTQRPPPICIVLGATTEPALVQRTFAAGAHGYVHRNDAPEEIVHAIERARSGQHHASPRATSAIVERLALGRLSAEGLPRHGLSEREQNIFHRLGRGERRTGIALALGVSARTIETHCDRIKVKLGLKTMDALRQHAAQVIATGAGT